VLDITFFKWEKIMSEKIVKEIIERAIEDEKFRKELFKHPEKALKGYDLTEKEQKLLEGLNEENFDQFAGGLGARTTKGAWRPG
jgi:hydroxylamine reductase (hybrid-cluster protein)